MNKRSVRRASVLAAFAAASLFAVAETWFDAGVSGYDDWPSDGSDKVVDGVGRWTGTTNTSYSVGTSYTPGRITISKSPEDSLDFNLVEQRKKNVSAAVVDVVATMTFPAAPFVQAPMQDAKGALCAWVKEDGSATNFLGLVKDPGGGTNTWKALSGVTPDADGEYTVKISLRTESGALLVRYEVNGRALALDGEEWNAIALQDSDYTVSKVCFSGNGDITALVGQTPEEVTFTPAVANASNVWVMVGGETLVPAADGSYTVMSGTPVTLKFVPDAGYALSSPGGEVSFIVSEDTVISKLPVAVNVAEAIKINEVMASNGDTLATANGGAELDWVELRNDADVPVDLTGWYINDSTKVAKATKIEGSCIVPAHGFKIIWCDKNYANWAEGEAHAKMGIGKSGGTMILAGATNDSIRVQMALPAQMKDVSYGLGRREKTVLDKLAPAQYCVGAGEWQDCEGPVGMPGATNTFKITSYKLDAATAYSIAAVEGAIASGKYAPIVVTNTEYVAYSNANKTVQTSPDFAPYYKHVSELGKGVITGSYYAFLVEGTIWIPRAGDWTFCVGSDDGFELSIYNEKYSFQSEYTGTRNYGLTPAIFRVQEPGAYNVRLIYFQGTASAALDFSVKEGAFDDYETFALNGEYKLVGLPESGITHAGAWAGYAMKDVSGEMLGASNTLEWKSTFNLDTVPTGEDVCRLKVKYADGFTATVNGNVVTNVPAAGQRTLADALVPAVFDIPSSFLVAGENTLAITAANDAVNSAEFLLGAEVTLTKAEEELVYFREPTPDAANTTAGYGPASPKVSFSVPHGYKTEAFDLTLSCADEPGATIYYTLDGSSPTVNSMQYSGPIHVSGTTCIRAAVPREGSVIQQDASATYLFLDDILLQARGTAPAGFPGSGTLNDQVMLYGMDQSVVNGADRDRLLRGFTNSVSTLSIVIDPENLFNKDTGIYVNAIACDGREWERLTMVEQIDPTNDSNGFSTAAGIRIRGAFSRKPQYPKHSLRLFFRNDYGDGPLEFPLFGDEGAGKFKKVDLRTSQNFTWSTGGTDDTFVHEVFSRDTQRDMGDYYTRSRFYNLFINGHYWGLYQTEERGDEDYAETYNGGDADLYDVIKTSQPGYVTGASEGTIDAWYALWDMAVNEGFSGAYSNNYYKAMGLNPDGSRNPEYPVYLNSTNLMDFMMCAHYTVDYDSPAAASKPNNLYAIRDRNDDDEGLKLQGFYYLRHDAEHSMGANTSNSKYSQDPTLRGTEGLKALFKNQENFNPAELHYKLCQNPEYRMAFADRFYKHCLAPGGALTVEKATERFTSRMAEIDDVVVCEAARWAQKGQTRQTWLNACAVSLTFITNRMPYMLSQYRARGWYPSVDAPAAFDELGNPIAEGVTLAEGAKVLLASSVSTNQYSGGTVYYTLDGSDPRLEGGAVAPGATGCPAAGFEMPADGATITARYLSASGEWSALSTIKLEPDIPSDQVLGVRVFAVDSCTADESGDGSEFIVLTNLLDRAVSLEGLRFTCAKTGSAPKVDVTLGAGREIPANGTVTLTKADDWPTMKITNGAVDMLVYDSAGETVQTLHFEAGWWNNACKGTGAYFIAKEFGDTVTDIAQWKPFPTDQYSGIRVAAVYSSTADGGGDGSEFIILTNLLDRAVSLEGLRLVATKTGNAETTSGDTNDWNWANAKNTGSSLYLVLSNDVQIAAGGTATFARDPYWANALNPSKPTETAKITNGAVDMRICDWTGETIQTLHIDAGWFPVGYDNKNKPIGACDGTGAHFIALDFGGTVTTEGQWKPSFTPPASGTAGYAAVKEASTNDDVRVWLNGLADTEAGYIAITNFSGSAAMLAGCYALNIPPVSDPDDVELKIPTFTIDAEGNITIQGSLEVYGTEKATVVHGEVRLYYADRLEDLATSATYISLGNSLPAETPPGSVMKGAHDGRFFCIKVE